MSRLTNDSLCDAIINDNYIEAEDLKEMKKQPNIQELYVELNKYESLMKKYDIEDTQELEEILRLFFMKG